MHEPPERLKVERYLSANDIHDSDLEKLMVLMGPGRARPFLEHFFVELYNCSKVPKTPLKMEVCILRSFKG